MKRIFILSPANSGGKRAHMLLRAEAEFDLVQRVRQRKATLGEVFSFLSGLYFRGKLAYGRAFARPPSSVEGVQVITPNRGLLSADTLIGMDELLEFARVPVDLTERRYTEPLVLSAEALCGADNCEVVLLGSIATGKYLDCLLPLLGKRLLFPEEFIGRGDMSRGGLMLRRVLSGEELRYIAASGAIRRGARPPRLSVR